MHKNIINSHKNIINSNNRSNHHLKHLVRGGLLFLLAITFGLVFIAISRKQGKKENKELTPGDRKSTNSAALATIVKNINKNPTTIFEDVNPISPLTDAITLNSSATTNGCTTTIIALPDGNLFATWQFGLDTNLYGKKITPTGEIIGDQMHLPLDANRPYCDSRVLLNENIFSIYVETLHPFGQITDQDLQPTAPSFQIGTSILNGPFVCLETFPTGDVVTGWSGINSIKLQYLTIDGSAIGPETNIGNMPNTKQPHITIQDTGKHTVFWHNYYNAPFALYMQKIHA
ncbi:MAG: hypothetical protein KAS93_00510, partial [Gammaproteobacteria bacterium]|nr:hypothetical protein [Gammaproteobacteria bacterium]